MSHTCNPTIWIRPLVVTFALEPTLTVLTVLLSTPVFAFTWLWSIKRGVEVGWALGGVGRSANAHVKSQPPPEAASTALTAAGIAPTARAEQLAIADFVRLAQIVRA